MVPTSDGIFEWTDNSALDLEKQPINDAGGTVNDWQAEKKVWVIGAENGKGEWVGGFTVTDREYFSWKTAQRSLVHDHHLHIFEGLPCGEREHTSAAQPLRANQDQPVQWMMWLWPQKKPEFKSFCFLNKLDEPPCEEARLVGRSQEETWCFRKHLCLQLEIWESNFPSSLNKWKLEKCIPVLAPTQKLFYIN